MTDDIEILRRELAQAREMINIRDARIGALDTETQRLQVQVDTLQSVRPKLRPENLIASFRIALEKMQEGLKVAEGRVEYALETFDTELKVNVTLDDEGNISFQLPKPDDIIPAENMSVLRLSLRSVPRVVGPPADTIEVPNVIGMLQEGAGQRIEKTGLTVGAVSERVSSAPPGTVLEQDPPPYSRTLADNPVELTISRLREVKVPDLVGVTKDKAVETIVAARLTVGQTTEEGSDSPPGTVINQSIDPDTVVPVDTAIDLVVAKEMAKVPDLLGMSQELAARTLAAAKLTIGEVTEEVSDSPPGAVISQSMTAGTAVPVGTSIDLSLAKAEIVVVPDMIGRMADEAKQIIAKTKLQVGSIEFQASDRPDDTVLGQQPKAGTEVPMGTSVELVVARSEGVVVPDLTGMTRRMAGGVLEKAELQLGETTEEPSREPAGTVIRQEPAASEKVATGTPVNVTLAKSEVTEVPDFSGKTREEAEQLAADSYLRIGRVTRRRSGSARDTVMAQRPGQGTRIPVGTAVAISISRGRLIRR